MMDISPTEVAQYGMEVHENHGVSAISLGRTIQADQQIFVDE